MLQGDRDFGRDLLDGALNRIRPLVRGDHDDVDHSSYTCQGFLESFQRSLSSPSGSTVKGSKASPWFELGLEIAAGYWYDPCDVPPGCKPKQGEPSWVCNNPDRVAHLLRQLDFLHSDVIPPELSVDGPTWSDDLPPYLLAGWERIEDGLRRLRQLHPSATDAKRPLNKAQQAILKALDRRSLTAKQLSEFPDVPRERSLFDDGKKRGHLDELRRQGLVKNLQDDGLTANGRTTGYYRPDAPPSDLRSNAPAPPQ